MSQVATRERATPLRSQNGAAPEAPVPSRDSSGVRLVAFAALAAYGTTHWAGLVADPPFARLAALVAVATAGGAALIGLGRLRLAPAARHAAAAPIAVITTLALLVVAGLPARLLLPGNAGELWEGVDRGLAGIPGVSWPYAGDEDWVRLAILLGAPVLLGLAAALTFWPAARARALLRALGLATLLLLYGTGVTEHDPGAPLLRGFVLFVLVGAFLWLPRLSPREAVPGAAVVGAVGLLSLPLASSLDGERPWWDYRSWQWFSGGKEIVFDWNHSYGPLDWPREGTTLLNVKSDKPHYWKAQVLDTFDGRRWLRSRAIDHTRVTGELPERLNPRWDERIRVTVRSLRSGLIVGAGNSYAVRGVRAATGSEDGTWTLLGEPLERGDSYTVAAYAPDPNERQMRSAPRGYPPALTEYTSLFVPDPRRREEVGATVPVTVPLRDDPVGSIRDARGALLASPYARVYRLALRLTAGAPTAYDAVKGVESHLRRNYDYNEGAPSRSYPLHSFLFEDRIGYCQQFSGAMALMLRMVGIPTRVVSGFAPGSYNKDRGEYRVRDLDAHSWVEVHFPEIGWVPFDPTPSIAPARSQLAGEAAVASATPEGDEGRSSAGFGGAERPGQPAGSAGASDGSGLGLRGAAIALAVLVLLGGAAVGARRWLLRRVPAPEAAIEAQLRELESALRRLGFGLPRGATLLALERRLAQLAAPGAAAYVARLRAHRYAPAAPRPPGPSQRRALRRELAGAAGGLRARVRALFAIPPAPFSRF